jgi:hypothetical protein
MPNQPSPQAEIEEEPHLIPLSTDHGRLPIGHINMDQLPEGMLKYLALNPHIPTPNTTYEFLQQYASVSGEALVNNLEANRDVITFHARIMGSDDLVILMDSLKVSSKVRSLIDFWERKPEKDPFFKDALRGTTGPAIFGKLAAVYAEFTPDPWEIVRMASALYVFRNIEHPSCMQFDTGFIEKASALNIDEIIDYAQRMMMHHETLVSDRFRELDEAIERLKVYAVDVPEA